MKRKFCGLLLAALLAAGMLCGCADGGNGGQPAGGGGSPVSSEETWTPHRFGKSDLTVNGSISLGMTVEEVKSILGQPDSEGTFDNDNFIYGTYTALTYGSLNLTFFDISGNGGSEFTLGTIWSDSEADQFAGSVHVGCTAHEIVAAFAKDTDVQALYFDDSETPDGQYLYGNYHDILAAKPKGVIEYAFINQWSMNRGYDKEYTIEYYYGDPLTWSDNDTVYSGDIYSLVCYMDGETDVATSVRLGYDLLM